MDKILTYSSLKLGIIWWTTWENYVTKAKKWVFM